MLTVNFAGVKQYIASGQNLNVVNGEGQTALMIGRIIYSIIYSCNEQ